MGAVNLNYSVVFTISIHGHIYSVAHRECEILLGMGV